MTEKSKAHASANERRYAALAKEFARKPRVTQGGSKGFGSGALKIDGNIFAMLTSKGEFVVKLPPARVEELLKQRRGQRFDPGHHGRLMKQWFVVTDEKIDWTELANEASQYCGGS